MLDLDPNAYQNLPEDTPKTPLSHLRRNKDNSPLKRRHYEQNILAQHSSKSWEHYTSQDVVKMVREVMGEIDLDPASSWLAQKTVKAKQWCGLAVNQDDSWVGVSDDWLGADGLAVPWYGRTYLNPPGGHTSLVRPELSEISRSYPIVWWLKLLSEYMCGNVTQAIYMGFSLEQMLTTQIEGTPSILDFPFCVPKKRLCFNYPEDTHDGKPISTSGVVAGKQPTHGNVIVYLPPRVSMDNETELYSKLDKFKSVFSTLGKVVIP